MLEPAVQQVSKNQHHPAFHEYGACDCVMSMWAMRCALTGAGWGGIGAEGLPKKISPAAPTVVSRGTELYIQQVTLLASVVNPRQWSCASHVLAHS